MAWRVWLAHQISEALIALQGCCVLIRGQDVPSFPRTLFLLAALFLRCATPPMSEQQAATSGHVVTLSF